MKKNTVISFILLMTLLIVGCSSEKKTVEDNSTASYLKSSYDKVGITRSSDVTTYVGQDLYEYINGGAELYHQYKFVEVATAYYQKGESEIIVDVYKFDNEITAYGLYSSIRPENPEYISIGAEGYVDSGRLDVVKGKYLLRITSFDTEGSAVLAEAAAEVMTNIPGSENKPEMFSLFPSIPQYLSGKFFIESYLGYQFLNDVYVVDYSTGDEVVSFFISDDKAGEKYLQWTTYLNENETEFTAVDNLPFDEGLASKYDHSFYGTILFGLKNGKLAGIVGYNESDQSKAADWLNSLPAIE